ncbi:heterokaryon incompatibility protein-domain-containing protein [Leptodontidium sp. MPI-SDFR-AT-0119]|nr:heterokaryon incompatibility protein-domain-containing protein [Leptodontidium sp. MPI-SDFR-AT-0119]
MEWDSIKCKTCEHAFDQLAVGVQREDISEEFDHHASLESFQAAVKEGCHLCNIVWDEWKLSDDQNKPPAGALTSFQMIYRLYVAFGRGPQYIWFGYRINNREKSGSREEEPGDIGQVMAILWTRKRPNDETLPVPGSELLQTKGSTFELKDFQHNFTDLHADSPPNPRRMMKLGIPVADLYSQAGSTASEWNLRLARAWLEDCVANHPLCEQRTTQKLPTRVLDVGSEPCDLVRLHISSEGECGSYATLSHCWGRKHLLMLEKDTESMLKAGIELSQLPNTFRDTILVARALSIKYIWIDSLCIYQDSTEDWRTESTKMGQIYMNCLLNIAATASEDSSGGLFRPRNPLAVKPAQITINAGYSIGKYDFWCWPGFLWDRQVEEGVLNTRGWVFQERLLAPRIVHFSSQLFWDCRMSAACETIPTGRPTPMPSRQKSPYRNFLDTIQLKKAPNLQRTSDTHEPEIEEVYTAWQEIVTTYSNRKFTKDSDILVAISGIAQEIQRGLTNYDQYYVGHWLQNLKKELLWSVGPLTVDTKANFTTSRICPLQSVQ